MRELLIEYLRPWKLTTFCIGLGLLLIGADQHIAPDWDYPISFIMATLTYLTAPWSVRVFLRRRWKFALLALFWFAGNARGELLCVIVPVLVVRLHLAAQRTTADLTPWIGGS